MSSSTAPELCSVRRPGEPQTSTDLSEPASRQPAKKKRRSADAVALGVTKNQAKYERASLGDGSGSSRLLTGSKARVDPQQAYPSLKKRAKTGAEAKWAEHIEWKKWTKSSSLEVCSKTGAILSITWNRDGEGVRDPLKPGSAKRRKFAVQYLFTEVFGSPKEPEWAAPNFHLRLSLPRIIMDMLDVPSKSKEAVIIAMRAMSKAHETGVEYDPSREIKAGRGAKFLIEDYTPQADVVYRTMESGMSLGNAMVVLNQWRRAKKMTPPSISYGCFQRFVKHSPVIVLEKRETVKAGSADEGTVWAGARLSFAKQVKRQLRKGARIAAGGAAYVPVEDGDDPVQAALEVPIPRGGVVFGDEHHRKTKLGRATKHECRIRRDGAGNVAPKERGGVLQKKNRMMTMKFHKEARGLFLVAEVKVAAAAADSDGEGAAAAGEGAAGGAYDGRRLAPLNYTEQWVIGIKEWILEFEKERVRVIPLPRKCGGVGRGYEDVAGAMEIGASGEPKWREEVKRVIMTRSNNAKRCVTDLIDHMITESKNLYKGTDMENKFVMFHDALAQWNEKEAQEYIEQNYPGFTGRFIKPVGTTCAGTIYKDKPPGNSPENARGLDSYGFADLEYAMCFNCALSWVYPYGDPRRIFGQGTPKEV